MLKIDKGNPKRDWIREPRPDRFLFPRLIGSLVLPLVLIGLPTSNLLAQVTDADGPPQARQDNGEQRFDNREFQRLLRESEFESAAGILDAAIDAGDQSSVIMSAGVNLTRALLGKDKNMARERGQKHLQMLFDWPDASTKSPTAVVLVSSLLSLLGNAETEVEELLADYDRAIDKFPSENRFSLEKAGLLVRKSRGAEAKAILDRILSEAQGDTLEHLKVINSYSQMLGGLYPEQAAKVQDEGVALAESLVGGDSIDPNSFAGYSSFMFGNVSRLARSEPKAAIELANEIESYLEKVELTDTMGQPWKKQQLASLTRLKSSAESELKRAALIGAPGFDFANLEGELHFVGMDKTSLADLKGKVVLLDFWAVWCGPCIATFPHLTEWHEKYAAQGLVIVGATRFYQYRWDEDQNKAVRSKEEVSAADELVMLEKFRQSYKLQHGFVVTPTTGDFNKEYLVSGIPQAVVLDRAGKIQMIRVGSGEANARDLEEKIKELLNSGE